MKSLPASVILLTLLGFFSTAGTLLIESSAASSSAQAISRSELAALEKREAAYRANNLGVAMLEQYKAKEAVEDFNRALAIKPDLVIARVNLSIAMYYLPDADGAKREAEKALIQDPNRPQPHYILGLIARAQNRFEEGIAQFQKVLKIDPDDVGSNINVGQIFTQQKEYADAIAAFRRAIAAEPYNETALYNLGILLTRTGNRAEAQSVLQKFQELKQSGAGTTIGTNYLEGGHYAEAVVSTGIEPELVERTTPDVKFTEATESWLGAASGRGLNVLSSRGPQGELNIPVQEVSARAAREFLSDCCAMTVENSPMSHRSQAWAITETTVILPSLPVITITMASQIYSSYGARRQLLSCITTMAMDTSLTGQRSLASCLCQNRVRHISLARLLISTTTAIWTFS